MQDWDDHALLLEFVSHDSESAFAELVARHVDKVYSVALRRTGNPHHAEEITQAVFVILARKARALGKGVVLTGWLYETARLTSLTFIRGEIRRAQREQEAYMQTLPEAAESETWSQIAPLLEAGMAGLSETDRHAIVLRFFDGRSLHDVGTALGASEDAAKKRVNRSVEKLRRFLSRRGVIIPAALLTTMLAAHSVHAAPAGLATAVSAAALAKGAAASASTLTLAKGALKLMAWTKAKLAIITVAAAVVVTAGTTVVVRHFHPPAAGASRVLLEIDWTKLWNEGRLLAGEVTQLEGKPVLKLESKTDAGLSSALFNVANPPITAMNYAITGDVKYDLAGVGHLAMWNFFPPLTAGGQEPQYYSFTGEETGPGEKLSGSSDWRPFSLPLDRTGKTYPEAFLPRMDTAVTAKPPVRLEVSVMLPGRGVIYLRNVKLVQTRNH